MAPPGLTCGTGDLQSSLWHAWSLSCSVWDLVPWPGIKPESPALRAWSLSHSTIKEVPPTSVSLDNRYDCNGNRKRLLVGKWRSYHKRENRVWKVLFETGMKQLTVWSHGVSGQELKEVSQASRGQVGPRLFSIVSQDLREALGWEWQGSWYQESSHILLWNNHRGRGSSLILFRFLFTSIAINPSRTARRGEMLWSVC